MPGDVKSGMQGFVIRLGDSGQSDVARIEARLKGYQDLRRGMLTLGGVDILRNAGLLSTAHTRQHFERTAEAFDRVLARLYP